MAEAAILNFGKCQYLCIYEDIGTKFGDKMHFRNMEMITWPKIEIGS